MHSSMRDRRSDRSRTGGKTRKTVGMGVRFVLLITAFNLERATADDKVIGNYVQ